MNGQQASIPTRGSHEQHRATNARLHEPWHLLQVACVVVVVLALFLFIGSILLDFANLRLICRAVHEQMPAMERRKDEWRLSELSSQLVTIITTEHYNLQTGRSMTVADANGRCTLFIGAVSGALIAIAFTGQVSRMGTAFFVFSLVLLPSLLLMGLTPLSACYNRPLRISRTRAPSCAFGPSTWSLLPSCGRTSSLLPMTRGGGRGSRWGYTHPGGRSSSPRRG